jgi:mRNA interferase MazF
MNQKDFPRRGEIYSVRLDPTDGKEINKTRPCLIISSDIANRSEIVFVIPITSSVERIFSRIEVPILLNGRPGKIVPRQMRSIDRTKRLGKKIGEISREELLLVETALKTILNL